MGLLGAEASGNRSQKQSQSVVGNHWGSSGEKRNCCNLPILSPTNQPMPAKNKAQIYLFIRSLCSRTPQFKYLPH
jgi:hypothetical protein